MGALEVGVEVLDDLGTMEIPPCVGSSQSVAIWRVPQVAWKARLWGKGDSLSSSPFSLDGVGPLTLHMFPSGDTKTRTPGAAALHIEAPLQTCLRATLRAGLEGDP